MWCNWISVPLVIQRLRASSVNVSFFFKQSLHVLIPTQNIFMLSSNLYAIKINVSSWKISPNAITAYTFGLLQVWVPPNNHTGPILYIIWQFWGRFLPEFKPHNAYKCLTLCTSMVWSPYPPACSASSASPSSSWTTMVLTESVSASLWLKQPGY